MIARSCLDCGAVLTLPSRGYGQMVRCRPCQKARKAAISARSLRSTIGRFNSGMHSAKRRGHEWRLTEEQYAKIVSLDTRCTYCGNEVNTSGSGLDRLDDSKPYEVGNVVPSCWPCNHIRMRGAFTPDEMMRLGPILGPIWKVHLPNGAMGKRG